jgi:hypothetical protein
MINGWNDVETSHVLGYNACTKKARKNKKPGDTSFLQMEVSKNGGTPKWMVYNGKGMI